MTARFSRSKWLRLRPAGAAICVAMLAAACGGGGSDSSSATGSKNLKTLQQGTVSVALTNGLMPYVGLDASNKLTGAEGDLFKKAANKLGLKVRPQGMEFSSLLAGIQSNRYDVGIGGIAWSKERANSALFTDPVYYSPVATLSRKGVSIHKIQDFEGHSVGALTATLNFKGLQAVPNVKLRAYPNAQAAVLDLAAGRIDSLSLDVLTVAYIKKTRPDLNDFTLTAIDAPTKADLKQHPGWSNFQPYQVAWYCSKKAAKLCKALSKVTDSWYQDDTTSSVLKRWGGDPNALLKSTPYLAKQRQGVDRPTAWQAPTLKPN